LLVDRARLTNRAEIIKSAPETTRLEEAVAAYRDALKERTRERGPLDWAATQDNLAMHSGSSASARVGRLGWRRRSPPFATPSRNILASACHSTGP